MKTIVNDTGIFLQAEDGSASHTLIEKPNYNDYGNVTARPLLTSYHLVRESIWERLCQCIADLQSRCQDHSRGICYALTFGALYPFLLSDSQAKNILYYGPPDAAPFLSILQDFMRFLQPDNSLVSLPPSPSVFSGLAGSTWHAAVIDLGSAESPQILYDAMTKVRIGGIVLMYTTADTLPEDVARFLCRAEKSCFSSNTLYTCTMEDSLGSFAYSCSTEARVLADTEGLPIRTDELYSLIRDMGQGHLSAENCMRAIGLLREIETILFASYDYLENSVLPVYASTLKELVMDCFAGMTEPAGAQIYIEKLLPAAQTFFAAMEQEFQ